MSRRRWSLIGLPVLIIGIGPLLANSWPIRIQAIDATADGPIFALVWSDGMRESRIFRWESVLSQREVLTNASRHQIGFHASGDAKVVAIARSDEIFGYDGRTGKRIWSITRHNMFKTLSVGNQTYIMAAGGGPGLTEFVLFDLRTGELVDRLPVNFPTFPQRRENLFLDQNQITVQLVDGSLESFAFSNGSIEKLDESRFPDGSVALGRLGALFAPTKQGCRPIQVQQLSAASDGTSVLQETDWTGRARQISIMDNTTGQILHRDHLGLSIPQRLALFSSASLLTFIWISMWRHRQRNAISDPDSFSWLAVDALFLSALIIAPYWVTTSMAPTTFERDNGKNCCR